MCAVATLFVSLRLFSFRLLFLLFFIFIVTCLFRLTLRPSRWTMRGDFVSHVYFFLLPPSLSFVMRYGGLLLLLLLLWIVVWREIFYCRLSKLVSVVRVPRSMSLTLRYAFLMSVLSVGRSVSLSAACICRYCIVCRAGPLKATTTSTTRHWHDRDRCPHLPSLLGLVELIFFFFFFLIFFFFQLSICLLLPSNGH